MTRPQEREEGAPDSQPSGVRDAPIAIQQRTLAIVGHGMVGQRVVEELRGRSELNDYHIVVFGKEETAAYDRVHLADVVAKGDTGLRTLSDPAWFEEQRVELVTGDPVEEIDRAEATITTRGGRRVHYEHLILATGSRPNMAKVPGFGGERVCPLRTLDDARRIRKLALESKERSLPVVIVGAGLLGIELADELLQLGVITHVLENADYPLCRQLEPDSGDRLAQLLFQRRMSLQMQAKLQSVEDLGDSLLVRIEGQAPISCGLVIPAMGVRPCDELARKAGLGCDLFGGIQVSDELLTSDPKISAIGECARHRGMTYGLVAPGYAMAAAVAQRLSGRKANFRSVQVGTRLKISGVELTCLGESAASGLGVRALVHEDQGVYRRLIVRHKRIIGLVSLGPWDDLPRAQEAFARQEKLRKPMYQRFERAEPMWKGSQLSLESWPDTATVCNCMGVSCGELKRARAQGCATVEALAERTGATTVCGSCGPLVATLTHERAPASPESRYFAPLSLLSLVGVVVFLVLPAAPHSETVQEFSLDGLRIDPLFKQATGWTLFAFFATSGLFSARKRLRRINWGDFESWRVAHALIGFLCLIAAFLHTGLRLGEGLDHALILVVLGSVFLGGVAGGFSLIEDRLSPPRARQLRAWLNRSHLYVLWPLPVLLSVHILKAYFF